MEPGFDLTVQHRDPKTGKVTRTTPYTMHIDREKFGGSPVYERDGKLYFANGQPVQAEDPVEVAKKKFEEAQKEYERLAKTKSVTEVKQNECPTTAGKVDSVHNPRDERAFRGRSN